VIIDFVKLYNKFFMKQYFNLFLSKKLRVGFIFGSGRSFGLISVHHRKCRTVKKAFYVDFFKRINSYGFIFKIIKTSLFTSFIGLIIYENGLSNYILLSENVNVDNILFSGSFIKKSVKLLKGYSLPLSYINLFSIVSNIELYPFRGMVYSRSAGTSSILAGKFNNNTVLLKLKSG